MPLQEKMRIAEFINKDASDILDIGCANGVVTTALAHKFPNAKVHGIDLDREFISKAETETRSLEHAPSFERVYLRELLERPERYDSVVFVSVLHEFYSYGNREPSVMKAVADAYELLKPSGKIVIRDMVPPEDMRTKSEHVDTIVEKIRNNPAVEPLIADFEAAHGPMNKQIQVNHFLLKYMYVENWERECKEHYVPVTKEQYGILFKWLGAEVTHSETYTLPYLRDKWRADFGLTDDELSVLFSTTIMVAQKPHNAAPMRPSGDERGWSEEMPIELDNAVTTDFTI